MIMGSLRAQGRVLIHSAFGGVGTAADPGRLQRRRGVFGTASAAEHEAIKAQGVHHAIDYRSQDFRTEVRRLTDRGCRHHHGRHRTVLVPQGLPDPPAGRPADHVRPVEGSKAAGPTRRRASLPAADFDHALVARRPDVEPESGVFGLNLLSWWRREGGMDRITRPLL